MRTNYYCEHCSALIGYDEEDGFYSPGDFEDFRDNPDNTLENVCDNCFGELYRRCSECGEYHEEHEFEYSPSGTVCDYCYEEE